MNAVGHTSLQLALLSVPGTPCLLSMQGLNKVTNVGLVSIAKHCNQLRVLHAGGRLNFDKTAGNVTSKAKDAERRRDLIANDGIKVKDPLAFFKGKSVLDDEDDEALKSGGGGGGYGAHLPGAGEGSDEESDDGGTVGGVEAILAEASGTAKSGPKKLPRTEITKVNTFFGIPKITGEGLSRFVQRCCTVEVLDLASLPGIDDAAVIALVTAAKRVWDPAVRFHEGLKVKRLCVLFSW